MTDERRPACRTRPGRTPSSPWRFGRD